MNSSNDKMRQALRLTRSGDLHAATRVIQQALGRAGPDTDPSSREPGATTASPDGCIEGEFRVVDGGGASAAQTGTGADSRVAGRRPASWARAWPRSAANQPGAHPGVAPHVRRADRGHDAPGDFQLHRFTCGAGELTYKLFIPTDLETTGAPLLLMLHGCTQTPDDFARGTRMNQLALEHGYVVAWPEQSVERNQNRCWNWFRGNDQQRGQGEPAILAGLTRQLVASHQLDAKRVYVAGLSAGGAMAAVLASTHPDVYAAIGVHSGLPIGLASDIPSAFAAMRKGGGRRRGGLSAAATRPVPAIVFHGDSDKTVHPSNADGVVEQSLGNGHRAPAGEGAVERGSAAGGRSFTRTVHRDAEGRVAAEHWVVHGSAHAWSGGDAAGSYTDPGGPDASAQMLRFFGECARPA